MSPRSQGINVQSDTKPIPIPIPQPQHLLKVIDQLERILGKVGDNRDRVENAIGHYFGAEPAAPLDKPEEQDYIASRIDYLLEHISKAVDQTSYSCDRLDTIF
jgi:hypothetical protein